MARPSQQLDLALLEAGEEELRIKGVRGLSVRAVCARAGVSPRMLNYYFESKDKFVRTLLTRGYKNFSREVEENSRGDDSPLDRLRRGLRVCLRHSIEGQVVLRNLIRDVYADEVAVSDMMEEHAKHNHTRIMYDLVEEAWRKGYFRKDVTPSEIFTNIMPGVFLPALKIDPPFPFNLQYIRELAEKDKLPSPEGDNSIAQEVERGMRAFELLLKGFLAENPEASSFRRPRVPRRAGSFRRRLTPANSGQSKSGKKAADHAKPEGTGHIAHHAEQCGENAE